MKLSDMEGSDLPEYISDVLSRSRHSKEKALQKILNDLKCSEYELLLALLDHV